MLTIDPRPARFIARKACLANSHAPFRSTANTRSHSASVISVASKYAFTPALFTSTSILPWPPTTASTVRTTSASTVTSAQANSMRRPPAASSPAAARPAASSRSIEVTAAPSAASFSTMARPMPRAPPVTSATLPARRPIVSLPPRPRPLAERFDLAGRALNEVPHRGPRAARIARANRLQNRAVPGQRRLSATRAAARRPEADQERRVDDAAHLFQEIVAARLQDRQVKPHGSLDERLDVGAARRPGRGLHP